VAGFCEYGNEPSGFIKCVNFLNIVRPVRFSGRNLLHGVSYTQCEVHIMKFLFM
jgi:hypothetical protein